MNDQEAIDYLNSFANYEKDHSAAYPEAFKLDRMRALAKELGNPQDAYESVIIVGSNGKGSTAAFLSSILRMENYRVGLYTSPHLAGVRERIQVNGLCISQARFTDALSRLKRALDGARWRKDPPTHFEMLTAAAFLHFKEMKIHVAVLEAGLGGLYDSTNIAKARAVGITPIGLEHTDKLGKTVQKIAVQKCGVIKGRELVVSSPQSEEAWMVIRKTAAEREAELLAIGGEIRVSERDHGEDFQSFDIRSPLGNYFDLKISLLGRHQIDNAATAVGLAKGLEKKTRLRVTESAVRQGLVDAHWPGRLEKIFDGPKIILDGAHNPDGIRKAVAALKRHFAFEKLIVVFGVSADKDLAGMLGELAPEATAMIFTQCDNLRAMPADALVRAAEPFAKETYVEPEVTAAVDKAKSLAGAHDLILVTGSLFLLGELLAKVKK